MSVFIRNNQVGGTYDSNHIYYNVSIVNNDTTGTKPAPPIIFNEIRNSPYLNNPNDYFMSVVRFSLQSSTLPVFIPQAETGQNDINKLIYKITLEYDISGVAYNGTANLIYAPQNINETFPAPPINFIDLRNEYYYVYSYDWFIQIVNEGFVNAYNDLNAKVVAAGGTLPSKNPPFMSWNASQFLATINCEYDPTGAVNMYDTNKPNPIQIFFNSPMYNLFSSFTGNNQGYNSANTLIGKNFQIMVSNQVFNTLPATTTPGQPGFSYPVLQLTQEYPTTPLWNPIQSIVFTTAFLPVVPELTAVPKVYGTDSKFFNVGNNANITNTLTDFEVGLVTGADYKPLIQYTPSGEYRLVDLFGNNPISALEIRIFWRDAFGNLIPFTLGPGSNGSIKIMFRKKALYNNDL